MKNCALFSGLPPGDLEEIVGFSIVKAVEKGDYLFREGDESHGFYVVQSGAISLHRINDSGHEQVIHVFRAGESFGEGALAVPTGYPVDAKAVEPSLLVMVQKSGFLHLLGRRPDLSLRMLATMSMRLRMLLAQIDDLTAKNVDSRLAAWLLKRCPDPRSHEPVFIELTTTKKVLAAELGTISETLSRALGHLREQGIITVEGKSVTVLSAAKLSGVLSR